MINISGYKNIAYNLFLKTLNDTLDNSNKRPIHIAAELNTDDYKCSEEVVRMAFKKDKQVVSDSLLTKIMNLVKLDGMVIWHKGNKYYYIKNGKK